MNKKTVLFALLVTLFLFVILNYKDNKNYKFVQQVNSERLLEAREAKNTIYESIELPSCNMSQEEMYSLFITKDNINIARNYYNYDNNVVLKNDAIEDINLLFNALKFGYGGYNTVPSSAESLLIYLRTVKNVIFIGTNSSGTTKIMDKLGFLLPNTKIVCAFGTKAYNYRSFEIEEGKGLEPDIWLGTEDILDRAYKFAKTLK